MIIQQVLIPAGVDEGCYDDWSLDNDVAKKVKNESYLKQIGVIC